MSAATADGFVTLSVRVTPRSARSEIVVMADGVWRIRLSSRPVDGAANDELVKLLAKAFGVSKTDIVIAAGSASRNKIVRIFRLDADTFDSVAKRFLP